MKLKTLQIVNFRCFDSLTVDFDEHLTVLVAPNGMGKTAVLDAIAIGLGAFLMRLPKVNSNNFKATDYRISDKGDVSPFMRIALSTYDGLEWDRTMRRNKSQQTGKQIPPGLGLKTLNAYADMLMDGFINGQAPEFPLIVYFGTGRGVFETPQRRRNFRKDFAINDAYRGALQAKANFKEFFEYFYFLEDWERREREEHRQWDIQQPELATIREAITRMLPGFSNPHSKISPLRFLVDWQQEGKKQSLRIDQLSDGYRTTLAMVMDIASRMAMANSTSTNVLDTKGIVLIDEVDLHLHPGWQQTILPDLRRTFPNVQFIVTTHSPQVLSTIHKDNIRVLGKNLNGQYVAHIPLANSYGEPSNDVLQAIMHIDPQPPVQEKQQLERLTLLVDQGHYHDPEAQSLLVQLKLALHEHHPQIQKIERSIRRQEALKQ